MSKVSETLVRQQDKCREEARKTFIKNAEECTFYIALGKCMRRELAEKYGLKEDYVGGILSQEACKLVDQLRAL